ncbi:hypothetical protein MG293_011255 [Ovis ammon polii]|uniref:Uncharacterized protein n=1 Tax=Ovis ammon polii TaxID=230172 RepID=A0AAD4U3W7_OVIAM|nr:hypothetical protein MG293_011255 [Ovis ammon polii]KAI4565398.1 hypothetical protein MJT46_009741 [Ovis ammon polii x Ovis aries]
MSGWMQWSFSKIKVNHAQRILLFGESEVPCGSTLEKHTSCSEGFDFIKVDKTAVEPHQRTSSACVPAVVADENHTQGLEVVSRRNKRTLDILKYGIERTGERSLWRETRLKRPVLMTLIGFNALEGTIGGDMCAFKKTAYLITVSNLPFIHSSIYTLTTYEVMLSA